MEDRLTILPIQYLRGIAALMVVWHHAKEQLPGLSQMFPNGFGAKGVDLFFVISGFIMLVTSTSTQQGTLQFWWRRIKRVVPLYWLSTLVLVLLWVAVPNLFKTLIVSGETFIKSIFFIPYFSKSFPDKVWPLLVPGWSLNYEMFFYFVMGVLLVLPRNILVATLSGSLLTLVCIGYLIGPSENALVTVYTSPLLLEFLFGVWIGAAWLKGQIALTLVSSIALISVGILLLIEQNVRWLNPGLSAIGAGFIVLGMLNPKISNYQSTFLRVLGDSSYSLYLTHIFTLGALRFLWNLVVPNQTSTEIGVLFMVCAMIMCVIVGLAVHSHIESKLARLFR